MPDHKINDRGFWETQDGSGHMHDESLMKGLVRFCRAMKIGSVVDFGCGMGSYVKGFQKSGIRSWGYDGNPNTLDLTNGLGETLDLSEPHDFGLTFDLVLSLEVGEHIPEVYEEIFINNLVIHANDKLVISWAVPGQSGLGHVNCKENGYIIGKLKEKGFRYDDRWSGMLRRGSRFPWFKKTVMVFHRDGALL